MVPRRDGRRTPDPTAETRLARRLASVPCQDPEPWEGDSGRLASSRNHTGGPRAPADTPRYPEPVPPRPSDFNPVVWAEDFRQAWAGLPGAQHGELVAAMRQLSEDFAARGGPACCGGIPHEDGTTSGWHRPWCTEGPIRFRHPEP